MMTEREIEMAIRAIDQSLEFSDARLPVYVSLTNPERSDLRGARDALEIELKRIRARRPA